MEYYVKYFFIVTLTVKSEAYIVTVNEKSQFDSGWYFVKIIAIHI